MALSLFHQLTSSSSSQQQLNNISALATSTTGPTSSEWPALPTPTPLSPQRSSSPPTSPSFSTPTDAFTDPVIFPYHIVPQRLTFSDLRQLVALSCLPTLLSSKSILVTNSFASSFTLDRSLLSHPGLFTSPDILIQFA
ncbi:hypothetical protein LINPERHAP2_LOCUS8341 [Linum perenne]